MTDQARALADDLDARGFSGAQLGMVLGSGLGAFAERLEDAQVVSYEDLPAMPRSAVPGHAGRLVRGRLQGVEVLVQQGRVHLYEGWSPEEVTRAVRAMAFLGLDALVLTNAAGGLREDWEPGTLMRVTDHLDLTGRRAPLDGPRAGSPYDEGLGEALERAAASAEVPLRAGVYAGLLGPNYETPAEVRMLRWMGADAVGMSTVLEASTAAAAGVGVAAVSCITNHAAGITDAPLSHDEVVETGAAVAESFARLLERAAPELAGASSR
jgi:purine-nucleoside phosphorylase